MDQKTKRNSFGNLPDQLDSIHAQKNCIVFVYHTKAFNFMFVASKRIFNSFVEDKTFTYWVGTFVLKKNITTSLSHRNISGFSVQNESIRTSTYIMMRKNQV